MTLKKFKVLRLLFCFCFWFWFLGLRSPSALGETLPPPTATTQGRIFYAYQDRDHSMGEDVAHVSALYGLGWLTYYVTQTDTVRKEGSWRKFRHNLGKFVFDKDEPFWNWLGHPYTGSQLYLYYRGTGHSKQQSLFLTFIQSTLFELTIEIYTEPASIQDLYQTPILGAGLGFLLEHTSLYLLNSNNILGEIMGHLLNPVTLFWFYEGQMTIFPQIGPDKKGLTFFMDF